MHEVRVRKADGRFQPFDRRKVIRTCMKLRVGRIEAERIADKISKMVYDGIPTNEILSAIYEEVKKIRPEYEHAHDLREAISMIRPKPDFEYFIGITLSSLGYRVESARIVDGRCIEHEIDGIAMKNDEVLMVEVKHHVNPHTYTGLDVFLAVHSTLRDLMDGYRLGLHSYPFTAALVACNTKISQHAERYARCVGIRYMGWRYPRAFALEDLITRHKLYPITMLKILKRDHVERLGDRGIVTLKQLIEIDVDRLMEILEISEKEIKEIKDKARAILG
ncbi:MAG TPA: restriction endonuclease [Candidatus Bathyarchaeota archaeon]|nr:restriction endonuclease [Candidatus Bathyarchaeota archaeon]